MANIIKSNNVRALPLHSAEISQQVKHSVSLKPEWLRLSDATRLFGIGRSSLYELINEGKIKSVSLRKRGNERGIRLLSVDSLSAYIESLAAE